MKKLLIGALAILTFGCNSIDITPGKTAGLYKKLGIRKDITEQSLKEIFKVWKYTSGLINIWYSLKDSKSNKELLEIKNKGISWRKKHALIKEKMSYKEEDKDIIYLPKTTYRRGCGDCEDLAALYTSVIGPVIYDFIGEELIEYRWLGYYVTIGTNVHVVSLYASEKGDIMELSNNNYSLYDSTKDWEKSDDFAMYCILDSDFNYRDFRYTNEN